MTRHGPSSSSKRSFALARVGSLFVLLTAAVAWAWAHEGHEALPTRGVAIDVAKGTVTLGPEALAALGTEVADVRLRALPNELVAPATIVARWKGHAYVSARLGGKVVALHVRPGQQVKRGERVAEVEGLELADLQRELLDAQNEARSSEKLLKSLELASQSGSIPDQVLEQARTLHQQNLNALEVARRKLLLLGVPEADVKELLRDGNRTVRALPVYSPLTGTALHVDVGVGQVVEPNEHLLEVVDLSRVWAQIRVLEKDLARVKVGQDVTIRLLGATGEWVGKVQVKERYLDQQTHWGTAWVELPNPQGALLPGLFGQARIGLSQKTEGLVFPAPALVSAGAERYVFVEEGPGQFRRQNVVVQQQQTEFVQVAQDTGLYPGDRVLTAGSHELASFFVQGSLRLSPEAERNIGLLVEPARRRTVAEVLTLHGVADLPPKGRAIVSARLAGALERIVVDRDQTVRAGDVVAEVGSLELQNLQLELLRSQLQAALLEQALRRLRSGEDAVPERMILASQTALVAARQRRTSLENKLRAAGLDNAQVRAAREGKSFVRALPVRAPIDGVVVRFRATLGQAVKAEDALFEIHNLSNVNLLVHVPERDLSRVKVGRLGRASLTASPGFLGEAVIVRRGQALGAGHRMLPAWADLKAAPGAPLLPGTMVRLTLILAEPPPTLAVPRAALLREGRLAYLFVRKKDGTFERRAVKTGRADDRFVEIARGLAEGELIAVAGVADLQTAHASIQ